MLVVIDNYDSFTYNLVQAFGKLGAEMCIFRNDQTTLAEIQGLNPSHIVISPGPGDPFDAGISLELIEKLGPTTPLLGVCLGHQSIGQAFGGTVTRAPKQMHGKVSKVYHSGDALFEGMPNPFEATRYHSLVIQPGTLPDELQVVAWTDQGEIMGVRHKTFPLEGVQFHPESFLTLEGIKLLANFLGR
jgi:anthranilate synthase/aminodeoxychorismate synthase-like glutamine amidotransferase